MNGIDENPESTVAAILLAAAAAQIAEEVPAPAPEPPTGNIDDLHRLWEQKAEIEERLRATTSQETKLREQLAGVLETRGRSSQTLIQAVTA